MNYAMACIMAGLGCLATQPICFAGEGNQDQLVAQVHQSDSNPGDSDDVDPTQDGQAGSDGRGYGAVGTSGTDDTTITSSPSTYTGGTGTYESLRSPVDNYIADIIKKDGNANKNHLVMISATWCAPCNRMLPMLEKLKNEGYIIYIFKVDKDPHKGLERLYKAKMYPTFLVYEGGKEIHRTAGSTTTEKWFKERLKKAPKPEPTPKNPYDGL